MAIPKPTITWDSYFDFNAASVLFRHSVGTLRTDNNG